jgi:hypothetical protein
MTHQLNSLLVGIAICLLSPIAVAATPTAAKAPATAATAPEAKAAAAPAAAPALPEKKRVRGGSDARKCLKQPDNRAIRRCAEKYR